MSSRLAKRCAIFFIIYYFAFEYREQVFILPACIVGIALNHVGLGMSRFASELFPTNHKEDFRFCFFVRALKNSSTSNWDIRITDAPATRDDNKFVDKPPIWKRGIAFKAISLGFSPRLLATILEFETIEHVLIEQTFGS